MKTSLFDYHLPPGRIAQRSASPRDHARLMMVDPVRNILEDRQFFEIGEYLHPGDLLVMNDTKVFKARLSARRQTGGRVEVFLLHPVCEEKRTSDWSCLLKPGKKVKEGDVLKLGRFPVSVLRKEEDGTAVIHLPLSAAQTIAFADTHGQIPTPPYVSQKHRVADYQTVYAKNVGSVAAPTAGFHFTPRLIAQLKKQGVRFAFVTLHVGIGTFRPMQGKTLAEHRMHAEWGDVPAKTQALIRDTKKKKRRVVAVGTTTVRALEGLVGARSSRPTGQGGKAPPLHGWINLFITPGFDFKIVDALITNFHLPKSTLLVLVSAFAGRARVRKAYAEAIQQKYRFFSFGDAMFIPRRAK